MKPRFKALRGTRDILPSEVAGWQFLEDTVREVFSRYGFEEIRTPLLESTELFTRSVGSSTDIVRKEMYTFERGDESFTLRPECTASVVRAFVEHAMYRNVAAGFPVRMYYVGPMFRYERPQQGRQRQFHQIGAEILGAEEPRADIETLDMLWALLDACRVADRRLLLGSVGDDQCRPGYRRQLVEWLEPRIEQMCDDCRRRFNDNPLRVLDCKVEADQRLLAEAPSMLDALCGACTEHFDEVRGGLEAGGIPFEIEPRLVRGLDYYQRTVFEVTACGLGAQNAILGGGRYDGLAAELGGPAVAGIGFAIGMERLLALIPADRIPVLRPQLALVTLGPEGFAGALALARRLRGAGLRVSAPLIDRPLGAQLKRAGRSGAGHALFVGAEELGSGRFGLKNLHSGEQIDIEESQLIDQIRQSAAGGST